MTYVNLLYLIVGGLIGLAGVATGALIGRLTRRRFDREWRDAGEPGKYGEDDA
jgi:hypothetical protein